MGVWIETQDNPILAYRVDKSHPVWVCGLKLIGVDEMKTLEESHPVWVCGLKLNLWITQNVSTKSHPVWVCGLKQLSLKINKLCLSHTLYGCVD